MMAHPLKFSSCLATCYTIYLLIGHVIGFVKDAIGTSVYHEISTYITTTITAVADLVGWLCHLRKYKGMNVLT